MVDLILTVLILVRVDYRTYLTILRRSFLDLSRVLLLHNDGAPKRVYSIALSVFYVGKRENAGGSLLDEFAQTIRKNHQYDALCEQPRDWDFYVT
jgi:hypothetical protein